MKCELALKKRCNVKYYFWYTLIFLGIMACVLLIFYANKRTLMWDPDGTLQHFATFAYARKYFLSIFSGSFSNYDFAIGQGADAFTTLNSYGLTDPFTYLCLLSPQKYLLLAYNMMIVLKLYMCGIFFIVFALKIVKTPSFSIVAGGLMYPLTGYCFFISSFHPNFFTGVLYLPLLLAGIEYYLSEGKRWIFPVAVFVLALSDYYSLYMDTVMIAVYILVRVFGRGKSEIIDGIKNIFKLIGLYLWGIAGAAFALIPTIYAFLNNARIADRTGYTDSILTFPLFYYKDLISVALPSPHNIAYTTVIGLPSIAIFALLAVFFIRKPEYRRAKTLFAICVIGLCVPAAGIVLNGLGYVTNRWVSALVLVCSVILVYFIPEFTNMPRKSVFIITGICCVYSVYLVVYNAMVRTSASYGVFAAAIIIAITSVALVCIYLIKSPQAVKRVLLSVVAVIAVAVNTVVFTIPPFSTLYNNYKSLSRCKEIVYEDSIMAVENIDDDSFWRVDKKNVNNQTTIFGIRGMSSWWSLTDSSRLKYYQLYELPTLRQNCNMRDLDFNASLETLAAGKYFVIKDDEKTSPPYGYELVGKYSGNSVYKNKYALPIGYFFNSYITEDEFEALGTVEKFEAVTQHAILDESDAKQSGMVHGEYVSSVKDIPYKIESLDGVSLSDGHISAEKDGSIVLRFDGEDDCETFLRLSGTELVDDSSVTINVSSSKMLRLNYILSPENNWYFESTGYTYNLGYSEKGQNYCKIVFKNSCEINYDDINIYCRPMESYRDSIAKLGQTVMEDVEVSNGHVAGKISCTGSGVMQLAIPCSDGWTAYVDGKKADLIDSGEYYMGLNLSQGEHTIRLEYHTPYMRVGIVVSLITAVGTLSYFIIRRLKSRKSNV